MRRSSCSNNGPKCHGCEAKYRIPNQGEDRLRNMIRKIKCDEGKPSCHKCVSTGRTCDGYESPFRLITSRPVGNTRTNGDKLGMSVSSQHLQSSSDEIAPEDIEILNHCLSTKTIFDGVKLDCNEEVRQVLQASLTNPSMKHAVLSLKALRKDLDPFRNGLPFVVQQDPSYTYGTQQYSMALKGLASNLSSLGFQGVKSTLLCCHIFISIEQVQGNYSAMAQHMIGGLGIMHEYRRTQFITKDRLRSEKEERLPSLDVFLIKLFAAPCKFEERLMEDQEHETAMAIRPITGYQQSIEQRHLSALRPNMRAELTKIATLTLEFLSEVSKIEPTANISPLLSEKAKLLDSLESWLANLESFLEKSACFSSESLAVSFMKLFHIVLKVVLLAALDFSIDLHDKLQLENDELQSIADVISERVKSYRM